MAKNATPSKATETLHPDAVWFRNRFVEQDDRVKRLRKCIEQYCADLEKGGLACELLAKELRKRFETADKGS